MKSTLCFDIGGTHVKGCVFGHNGEQLAGKIAFPTPRQMGPSDLMPLLVKIGSKLPRADRISAGFPGVVKNGVTYTATNLGSGWKGFQLGERLEHSFGVEARVANDADVQGLGVISGRGVELVFTFGTGLGSALFCEGTLVPNLQLGHLLLRGKKTYEDILGLHGFNKRGKKKWIASVRKVIPVSQLAFSWDHLYLGGGLAVHLPDDLADNVKIVPNEAGLSGGLALWKPAAPVKLRRVA